MNGVEEAASTAQWARPMSRFLNGMARTPELRRAEPSDAEAIGALMRSSILDLFPRYYDERQTESAALHVAHVDLQLIDDGTYLVHAVGGDIVACGGWSRRGKLYTGSGSRHGDDRLLDPSTEAAHTARCSCTAAGPGGGWAGASSTPAGPRPSPRASGRST